jgi:ATP adenylyltransferase
MKILSTPWRMAYIQRSRQETGCLFCDLLADPRTDAERFILHRARRSFLVLNIYPYTPGHLMVVPYAHAATLGALEEGDLDEMLALCQLGERLLRRAYGCRSIHAGANLGQAAGAGVPEHVHFHVVAWPEGELWERCTTAETLPEHLETTYDRFVKLLPELL